MSAWCGGCTAFAVVVVIVTSALLGVSWQPVNPQQWGIAYNSITMTVDAATVYSAGRFYVGVGGSFFTFPRVAQYAEFVDANSLDVWSSDGQKIFLEVSYYYSLPKENVLRAFTLFGNAGKLNQFVQGLAAETIRGQSTSYATIDFFTNRSSIDLALSTALQAKLSAVAYVTVTQFNLQGVDVPPIFDSAVQNKVLAAQNVITLEQLRQSQVLQSQVAVITATANAQVAVIVANATAQASLVVQAAAADNQLTYMSARGSALGTVAGQLGFATSADLAKYLYTDIMRGYASARTTLAVGVGSSTAKF